MNFNCENDSTPLFQLCSGDVAPNVTLYVFNVYDKELLKKALFFLDSKKYKAKSVRVYPFHKHHDKEAPNILVQYSYKNKEFILAFYESRTDIIVEAPTLKKELESYLRFLVKFPDFCLN